MVTLNDCAHYHWNANEIGTPNPSCNWHANHSFVCTTPLISLLVTDYARWNPLDKWPQSAVPRSDSGTYLRLLMIYMPGVHSRRSKPASQTTSATIL